MTYATLESCCEAFRAKVSPYDVQFDKPGHPDEYTIHVDGYGHNTTYIPEHYAGRLQAALGDEWRVENRGSRIEVKCLDPFGSRQDHVILTALDEVFTTLAAESAAADA